MKNARRLGIVGTFVVLIATGLQAQAGFRSFPNVTIYDDYAYGAIGTTRNSADNVQYLGCTVYGTSGGTQQVICKARNTDGKTAACTSSAPAIIQAALAVNGDSYVWFGFNADGNCTRLYGYNWSWYAPKNP